MTASVSINEATLSVLFPNDAEGPSFTVHFATVEALELAIVGLSTLWPGATVVLTTDAPLPPTLMDMPNRLAQGETA